MKILKGRSDANVGFDELRNLLINLAKPYQVRQVRNIITRYKLGGDT